MAIWGWSAVFPAVWGPDRLAKSLGDPRLSEEMGEEELAAGWSLSVTEIEFVGAKAERHRLGLAAQLKFFAMTGRFLERRTELADAAARYLAEQLDRSLCDLTVYDWSRRSGRRHRGEILGFFGVRALRDADLDALRLWVRPNKGTESTTRHPNRNFCRFAEGDDSSIKMGIITEKWPICYRIDRDFHR